MPVCASGREQAWRAAKVAAERRRWKVVLTFYKLTFARHMLSFDLRAMLRHAAAAKTWP